MRRTTTRAMPHRGVRVWLHELDPLSSLVLGAAALFGPRGTLARLGQTAIEDDMARAWSIVLDGLDSLVGLTPEAVRVDGWPATAAQPPPTELASDSGERNGDWQDADTTHPAASSPRARGGSVRARKRAAGSTASRFTQSTEAIGYRDVVAMHATSISQRWLDYLARTRLVEPDIQAVADPAGKRLYSFHDLMVLYVVKALINAGAPLPIIREAVGALQTHEVDRLAEITLIVDGPSVYMCRSAEEVVSLLQGGQAVFGLAIAKALEEIESNLSHLTGDGFEGSTAAEAASAIDAATREQA